MAGRAFIGCQGWAHPPWVGRFFTRDARREDFLPQYASVFPTAEGNATFYGLPAAETVRRWGAEAPAHFRFAFKFPRAISHERRLAGAEQETAEFLARVAPLGERLGPFFLQVHQSFRGADLPVLARYLATLPREFSYAVEVRAPEFFDDSAHERALDDLLQACGCERVVFDTRALFASKVDDEFAREARRKKPRVPVKVKALGPRPFVRVAGDPDIAQNRAGLTEWARQVAGWIAEGREPWFFLHHADDTYTPHLARLFQELLHAQAPDAPPPPVWPVERERAAQPEQLGLF